MQTDHTGAEGTTPTPSSETVYVCGWDWGQRYRETPIPQNHRIIE